MQISPAALQSKRDRVCVCAAVALAAGLNFARAILKQGL